MKQPLDINYKDEYGNTALHYACFNGFDNVVEELLVRGADCAIKNAEGRLPIEVAMMKRKYTVVMLLLERNQDLVSQGDQASAMLYTAMLQYSHEFAQKLCAFSVMDLQGCKGKTTLFLTLTAMKEERYRYSPYTAARVAIVKAYEAVVITLLKNTAFLTTEMVVGTEVGPAGAMEKRSTALALLVSDRVFDNCVQVLLDTKPTDPVVLQALFLWAAKRGRVDVIADLYPVEQPTDVLLTPAAAAVVPSFDAAQQLPVKEEKAQASQTVSLMKL